MRHRELELNTIKQLARELCPPLVWRGISSLRARLTPIRNRPQGAGQDLDIYWDPAMAAALETWGERNAWNEIQLLLWNQHGKVLDIACGTGKVMNILSRFPALEVHGCDISDFLLDKAVERGIARDRLTCCDATRMPYPDESFDYAYSIGSLEHFTEEGIVALLSQCKRVVRDRSFHMIPVSRSGKNEGWIQPYQSYFNNSVEWWVGKCRQVFTHADVLESVWDDERSRGIWLVCRR